MRPVGISHTTISRCLAKLINESQTDWDEKIDTVLMGYRASRQASTKHSPYFLLFHQRMRLPIDNELLPSTCDQKQECDGDDEAEEDLDEKIEILLASREKAFKEAEANIKAAQKNRKETYDRKHQPKVLPEGTEVLLENTYQKQRKGGKMEPLWLGPYTVHRHLGKGLYELMNRDGKVMKKTANINRLKTYMRRQDGPSRKKGKVRYNQCFDIMCTCMMPTITNASIVIYMYNAYTYH